MNLVQAATLPIEQQIAAERQANLARAQSQMGYAKAAAAIMQAAAPRVEDSYNNAANADAGYARGLGDVVQQGINQNQEANNAFLQKMGTPASAIKPAAPVGDIAYGLQGYIPASTLQREGAAWESAAQLAPGDLLKSGQQQAASTLANDPNLSKLEGDLSSAASSAAYHQAALSSENAYRNAELGLRAQSLNSENRYRAAEIGLRHQSLAQGAERLNIEAQRAADSSKQAWARIGIQNKHLQLEIAKQDIASRSGCLSTAATSRYTSIAQSWLGRTTQATINPTTGKAEPSLSVPQAFTQALKEGVPLSIMVKEALQMAKGTGQYKEVKALIRSQYGSLDNALNASAKRYVRNNEVGTGPASSAWSTAVAKSGKGRMIEGMARSLGLDPGAVMAIASQEGLGGGVGDNGTSFGPFQMHLGGVFPMAIWHQLGGNAQKANEWAWSPQGIEYALRQIAQVARGLQGDAAIAAISRRFERPANPRKEIAGAEAVYGNF